MDILKLCVKCYKERDQNEFQLQNGKTSKRCKSCRDSINKYYSEYRKTENYQDWLQTSMKEHQKKSYQKNIQNRKEYYNKNKQLPKLSYLRVKKDNLENTQKQRIDEYLIDKVDKKDLEIYKDGKWVDLVNKESKFERTS